MLRARREGAESVVANSDEMSRIKENCSVRNDKLKGLGKGRKMYPLGD